MKELEIIDQPDGSAIVQADLTEEESKALAELGLRWAIILAAFNITEDEAIDLIQANRDPNLEAI